MATPDFGLIFAMAATAIAVTILINSAALWAVLRLSRIKNRSYARALKAAAISGAIMFFLGQALIGAAVSSGSAAVIGAVIFAAIPLLTFAVNRFLLKRMYTIKGRKAILMAIAWTLPGWAISNIVAGALLILLLNSAATQAIIPLPQP